MKTRKVLTGLLLSHLFTFFHPVHGQENDPSLSFVAPENPQIPHRLEVILSSNQRQLLYGLKGAKIDLNPLKLTFDGISLRPKSIKTRGNTSNQYKRKSLSLHFQEPMAFEGIEVERLAVNNLVLDYNYWRNRVCFTLMEQIGIFPLKHQYTEVRINGQTEGTYLSVQKPEDYIRSVDSKLLLRRIASGQIEIDYVDGADEKAVIKKLKGVKKITKSTSGEALYNQLNEIVVLDNYFRWLAFNFLVMNGDYTDELFFYQLPEDGRLDIIPWDYDDVYLPQPHEGLAERNRKMSDRLLFSSEAYFDLVVDQHDYLYQKYLEQLSDILEKLTPEILKATFEQVFTDLYPFYADEQIINQSAYDAYGVSNFDRLKDDLTSHYQFALERRTALLEQVTRELDRLESGP